MNRLLIGAAIMAALAGIAMRAENLALRADLVEARAQLDGCAARTENLAEDKESDHEIDALDDAAFDARGAEWVFPAGDPR